MVGEAAWRVKGMWQAGRTNIVSIRANGEVWPGTKHAKKKGWTLGSVPILGTPYQAFLEAINILKAMDAGTCECSRSGFWAARSDSGGGDAWEVRPAV